MIPSDSHHPDPLLDAFLDGQLSAGQREQMLGRLEQDPALRAQCEQQAAINASLKRMFSPSLSPSPRLDPAVAGNMPMHGATGPGAPASESRSGTSVLTRQPPARIAGHVGPRRLLRAVAMAAIILISLGYSGWTLVDYLSNIPRRRTINATPIMPMPASFITAYQAAASSGFQPEQVSHSDQQLDQAVRKRFGQPLRFRPDPPAVRISGWSFGQAISHNTLMVIGAAHGRHVLVFIDRLDAADLCAMPLDDTMQTRLHLFHRQIGELILYELTPLDHAVLLPRFDPPGATP